MTVGTSPEDARTRRIVAEVVSNTLAIAMERAGAHGNVFGHWMAVLDEAKWLSKPVNPDTEVLR